LSSDRAWTRALASLGAALALGCALQAGDGQFRPWALAWMLLGLGLAWVAVATPSVQWVERQGEQAGRMALFGTFAIEILMLSRRSPGIYLDDPGAWRSWPLVGLCAAMLLLGGLLLRPRGPFRDGALPGLLLVHLALGVWLIHASPHPHIDVHVFQQDAAAALMRGQNPYAMTFADIYTGEEGASARLYGAQLSSAGRLAFGFPYPPLTLFLGLPGALLGDHRYAQLGAMTLSGALMGYARPGWVSKAAAAAYLFFPRTFFVLEQGWTEPFGVLAVAGVVFCALRAPRLSAVALGLLVASKQYLAFALPLGLVLLPRAPGWRGLLRVLLPAALAGLLVTAPLALWDLHAFWRDVVELQFHQPFRPDALSVLALWGTPTLSAWPAWAAMAVGMAVALWRAPRSASGFALAVAVTFYGFFAFNKQAFCNYYYFVAGALCVAVAAGAPSGIKEQPARIG
jgi:hypothetical protein